MDPLPLPSLSSAQQEPGGPDHPADWVQKYNLVPQPGLCTATNGSPIVQTTADLRKELSPGDILRVGDQRTIKIAHAEVWPPLRPHEGAMLIAQVESTFVRLAHNYAGPTRVKEPCYRQLLSADAFIARTRDAADAERAARLAGLRKEAEREEAERELRDAEEDLANAIPPGNGTCARNVTVPCGHDADCESKVGPLRLYVGPCCGGTDAHPSVCAGRPSQCCVEDENCRAPGAAAGEDGYGPCIADASKAPASATSSDSSDSSNCTGVRFPGTVSVVRGSPIVTTSVDLRTALPDGDRVDIGGNVFTATQPRDEMTLTLSAQWDGDSAAGLWACAPGPEDRDPEDCVPLSGCVAVIEGSRVVRTSEDLRDEIDTGEVIVIGERGTDSAESGSAESSTDISKSTKGRVEATVTNPRDARTLTLSGPYTGPTAPCVPACRRSVTWDGGLVPLCGTVSVDRGSRRVRTTCDLRDELSTGDLVRIGKETGTMTSPFTDSEFALAQDYSGRSVTGVKAYKQVREVPLSGVLSVVEGSATVTTSADLRGEIAPGDMVKIYQRPGAPDLFAVVAPQDAVTLTIARRHPGPTASGLKGYKAFGTLNALSGTVSVTRGSTYVATTMDLTGEVVVGDGIRIDATEATVTAVSPTGMSIRCDGNSRATGGDGDEGPSEPDPAAGGAVTGWPEESAEGLRAYRVGKSASELTLEQLSREKLKCTSIYCIAKIEELERGLPFAYPRILKGGAYGQPNEDDLSGEGRMRGGGGNEDSEDPRDGGGAPSAGGGGGSATQPLTSSAGAADETQLRMRAIDEEEGAIEQGVESGDPSVAGVPHAEDPLFRQWMKEARNGGVEDGRIGQNAGPMTANVAPG
jgi:hypothetical protein